MSLIYFILIIFLSSVNQGINGFGFVLIAAPLSLLFLDKFTVLASIFIVSIFLNSYLLNKIQQPINWKIFIPLALASLIGMPLGLSLLIIVPIEFIKIVAGSLAIIFTFLIVFQKSAFHANRFLAGIAGLLSGVLHTSIGMSGPPAVMLLAGSGKEKNEIRKTMAAFLLWLSVIALPIFFIAGHLTWERVSFGFYALPFVFAGAYLGTKIAHKLSQKTYKILALILVCITGLVAIYSGLFG